MEHTNFEDWFSNLVTEAREPTEGVNIPEWVKTEEDFVNWMMYDPDEEWTQNMIEIVLDEWEQDALEYKPSNRVKVRTPKSKSKFWCSHCDANRVGTSGKCSNCGKKEDTKKFKK